MTSRQTSCLISFVLGVALTAWMMPRPKYVPPSYDGPLLESNAAQIVTYPDKCFLVNGGPMPMCVTPVLQYKEDDCYKQEVQCYEQKRKR